MKNTKRGIIDLIAVAAIIGLLGSGYSVSKTSDLNKEVNEMKIEKQVKNINK